MKTEDSSVRKARKSRLVSKKIGEYRVQSKIDEFGWKELEDTEVRLL